MMKRGLAIILILLLTANIADSQVMASENSEGEGREEHPFNSYFLEYFTYESMLEVFNKLENEHPDIVKVYDLTATIQENEKGIPSHTWQGRKVWAVKVSDGVSEEPDYYSDPEEADILIMGAHHGSEWTGFEVSMYFLFYLVEYYGMPPTDNDGDGEINEDPINGIDDDGDGEFDEDGLEGRVTWLVDNREIWIVPMQNPDGVAADTRKNGRESVPGLLPGQTIPSDGVNTNRNYPYMWGSPYDPSTGQTMDTPNPTASEYRGPKDGFDDDGDSRFFETEPGFGIIAREDPNKIDEDPVNGIDDDNDGKIDEDPDGGLSEPETLAIANLVELLDWNHDGQSDIITSISHHTFSELIIYPWGYADEPTPNDALFQFMGEEMSESNGYDVIQGPELYPTSGDVDDWLYGVHRIMAYTFELGTVRKVPEEELVNISMMILPSHLYLAENAPVFEVARERYIPNLDIGLPMINHTQRRTVISSDYSYTVEVQLANADNLDKNSVYLYYKVGEDGEWKEKTMVSSDDVHYRATIPRQRGNRHVYYYVEGRARYNEAKSINEVIYVSSPKYGRNDPYSYFVDISLGDTFGDIAAMITMMVLVFGIVYSGLGKSLKMAVDAEKRKSYL